MSNQRVLEEAQADRELLFQVKKRNLQYFGHIARQGDSLDKDILLGMTNGKRRRGRPRTSWMANMHKDRQGLARAHRIGRGGEPLFMLQPNVDTTRRADDDDEMTLWC